MAENYIIDTRYGGMFYSYRYFSIGICIDIYKNFYQVIRGINHEEIHDILRDLFDTYESKAFDQFIRLNKVAKDSLYELKNCVKYKKVSKSKLTNVGD